jgi:hypothetical protein
MMPWKVTEPCHFDRRGKNVIDGRPHFAKHSIDDGKQVKIAAIDPDFN